MMINDDGSGEADEAPTLAAVRDGLFVPASGAAALRRSNLGEVVRLQAACCERCDTAAFPVRLHCETCGEPTVVVSLGEGATLEGVTEVVHPPPGAKVAVPYGVGLARFPEGIVAIGLLDPSTAELAHIGTSVRTVAYEAYAGSVTYAYQVTAERNPD